MSSFEWLLLGVGIGLVLYLGLVAGLLFAGRRMAALALARFIPDCVVLLRRLLSDPQVSRWRKLALLALVAYLAMPIDLVPDFIPVAGQVDDVIVAALALRLALRSGGPALLRRHWPGPDQSLQLVMPLAYGDSQR